MSLKYFLEELQAMIKARDLELTATKVIRDEAGI